MLINYFKTALRNIQKRKIHSLINIVGFAIALASFALIMLWIQDELSYDCFNKNADRIYRVSTFIKQDSGNDIDMAMTCAPLASELAQIPEVEKVARIQGPIKNVAIKCRSKVFSETNLFYADQSLFSIFSFHLLEGNVNTVLKNSNSIVLTKSMADKYFGKENAIGKVISISSKSVTKDYLVTGVMQDIPEESHFHINFVASLSTLENEDPGFNSNWSNVALYTYVLLFGNASSSNINEKIPGIIEKNMGKEALDYWSLNMQKMIDIHLHSHRLLEIESNGNISGIYISGTAAFLLLLVAIINFISLTTAKYLDRIKEIGIRKILGARRTQIIVQFIIENFTVIIIGYIISIALIALVLPYFNLTFNKTIILGFKNSYIILFIGLLLTSIPIIYPAILISFFLPAQTLNKRKFLLPGGISVRKTLVIIQFTIAMIIIMGSFVINNQLHYILHKDLGIKINNTVFIPLRYPELRDKYKLLRKEFMKIGSVKNVSASSNNPVNMNMINSLYCNDKPVLEVKNIAVDYNFLKTMGIKLISGRNFSEQFPTDTSQAIIVNEAAYKKLRAMNLFNCNFQFSVNNLHRNNSRIIGVVTNYNYRAMYYAIEPIIFYLNPKEMSFVEINISSENLNNTIDELKQKWEAIIPNYPFDYTFLDQTLKKEYEADLNLGNVLNVFSWLAVFIGCMGLLGLASYASEKRTKEIGIRKVLGSSVNNIIFLLAKDFLILVFIAGIIAAPLAFYITGIWLNRFVYKTTVNPLLFISAIVGALVISFLTISYHTIKAATTNPIKSLKYE